MPMPKRKRLIGFATLALVVAAWIGALLVWLLLDPSLAQWALTMTVVAIITEVGMWIGAAILGVAALQRLRSRFSLFSAVRK